ncbi:hypothetical protein [Archangium lansingense]|uniref:YcxB-like protein domain-containing protein n=1 Tax=Archangium lansingense TaxID=2995310 RepID=A0ABT4A2Q8_9BACT|nr:hypothetical protein [Archangium lansinium]MCY1075935.1 hypothetical protein [Archangium lansinium]
MELPFQLQYSLSRRQRLIPHLVIWAPYLPAVGFLSIVVYLLTVQVSPWWALLSLWCLWLVRGFMVGLTDVALRPLRHMDVVIQERGLGFLRGNERWWIFLDGIINFGQIIEDTWTLQHYNGVVIHIPVDAITPEQVEFLQAAAARRRLPMAAPANASAQGAGENRTSTQ